MKKIIISGPDFKETQRHSILYCTLIALVHIVILNTEFSVKLVLEASAVSHISKLILIILSNICGEKLLQNDLTF